MAGRAKHAERSHFSSHERLYGNFSLKALRAQDQRSKHDTIADRLAKFMGGLKDKLNATKVTQARGER